MGAFDVMMVALKFNEKINQRDLDGLVELMTDDHTFIDNSGDTYENMKKGWREFFENHPDYRKHSPRSQSQTALLLWLAFPPAPTSHD